MSSMKPPTFADALEQQLLSSNDQGIHTFSNGTEYECWAASNCERCQFFDPDEAGALCAFECAGFLHLVSPALARQFGWTRNPENAQDGEIFGWDPPLRCAFFRDLDDPPIPFIDPDQLSLLHEVTA